MDQLFTLKESTTYPGLFVKKYKRKVFYDNLWNDELVESRGRVLDKDGNVVINPFTKIFNYKENNTTIPIDEPCLWVNKVNGFMASATYVDSIDKVVICTTGSLDSEFTKLAEKYINARVRKEITEYHKGYTLLFEICAPEDPHIIKEDFGVYLIGIRKVSSAGAYFSTYSKEQTLDVYSYYMEVNRPRYGLDIFQNILNKNKVSTNEGVVVYSKSGTVLKLKTPYYLATKAIARSKDIFRLKRQFIDEEYYPLIEYLKNIKDFNSYTEEEKLSLIRKYYA